MIRYFSILALIAGSASSSDLEMKAIINTGVDEIILGQGVDMEIEFSNGGPKTIVLDSTEANNFVIEVFYNGNPVDKTKYGRLIFSYHGRMHPNPPTFVSPNEPSKLDTPIPLSRAFDLSMEGSYKVRVKYSNSAHDKSAQCDRDFSIISLEEFNSRNVRGNKIRERNQIRKDGNATQVTTAPFEAPDNNSPHALNVISSPIKFSLGSSPIRVVYNNKSETDPWDVSKPDTCARLMVYVSHDDHTELYVLNQIFHMIHRKDLSRIAVGPKDQLFQIKPGTTFEFPLDIYTIPIDWQPGVYELWLRDDNAKLGSNKIKFRLEANEASIPILTKMASDEIDEKKAIQLHLREIRRNFALTWLAKNLDLHVLPITDNDTTPVVEAKLAQNRHFIDEFLQKWPMQKDAPETKALFESLNRGVPINSLPDPTALWNQINPNKNNTAVKPPAPPTSAAPKTEPVKPPAPPPAAPPEKPVKPPTAPNDF